MTLIKIQHSEKKTDRIREGKQGTARKKKRTEEGRRFNGLWPLLLGSK